MIDLPELKLPKQELKIKYEGSSAFIFDIIRKKYLVLTPEEWVRQNFLSYLINFLNYPGGLIQVERSLKVGGRTKRFDALVYNHSGSPVVIIEFKAPDVKINQAVFNQAGMYNSVLKVPYMIVSNGIDHFFAHIDMLNENILFFDSIPDYREL